MKNIKQYLLSVIGLSLMATAVQARDFSDVEIKVKNAAGQVYMLEGAGGNIGVLATEQGLLLVDDQFSPLAKKIETAMKGIADQPLKYVVNTHYHGDHTGGNKYFGHHAPIFAHENVRNRLQAKDGHDPVSLPVVTYKDGVNIHMAKERITLTHLPAGHTDSDTFVYFNQANVLHTGDLFFESRFPYVDLNGGGSVKGYLNNVRHMIANTPDDVVIIPGHGKLTDKASLKAFADMIDYSINRVSKALADGKSEADILAMGIGEQYKDHSWNFITEERWLKTLVADLK